MRKMSIKDAPVCGKLQSLKLFIFNRVNNNIFPLSWKKYLFDAVVVDGRQGLTDWERRKFVKPAWKTIRSCSFRATFRVKNKIYSGRWDIINILWF